MLIFKGKFKLFANDLEPRQAMAPNFIAKFQKYK